jgi:hypothetical protein
VGEYLILIRPSTNRVYASQAAALSVAELRAVASSGAFHTSVEGCEPIVLGGVEYIRLAAAEELDADDLFVLSNLSFTYAVFARQGDALVPIEVRPLERFPSDLITIQRYNGKTNEQFTHLLVNLAVAASRAAAERAAAELPVRVLDPLAGRGTTLNRALTYGYDACGIEIDAVDVDAYRTFLTTYLKNNRRKHKLEAEASRRGPLAGVRRFAVRIDGAQRVEMLLGDTSRAAEFFGARSFDVLVADLPYGVQHRSGGAVSRRRSPEELLVSSLPSWRTVLRGGAGVALAWNVKTMSGDVLRALLTGHGFDVVSEPGAFEHTVDRTITRDVIIART